MEEILSAVLSNPAFRSLIEGIAIKVVASIFHRRTVDPEFLAQSNAVFSQMSSAKTEQELTDAQNSMRNLMFSN